MALGAIITEPHNLDRTEIEPTVGAIVVGVGRAPEGPGFTSEGVPDPNAPLDNVRGGPGTGFFKPNLLDPQGPVPAQLDNKPVLSVRVGGDRGRFRLGRVEDQDAVILGLEDARACTGWKNRTGPLPSRSTPLSVSRYSGPIGIVI